MAHDLAIFFGHQRKHGVTIGAQIIDQIGFGSGGKAFQMYAADAIAIRGHLQPHQNFPAIQKSNDTTTLTMMQVMMGK